MTDLLDLMREPMVVRPVDIDGQVVIEPRERLTFGVTGTRMAAIELHPSTDGSWMWSTSFGIPGAGRGYRVGEKWGRFARTRDDALHYAVEEMRGRLAEHSACPVAKQILAWARGLR